MAIRRIRCTPRLSHAVVHGNSVYLTGQVGAGGQSVADQTRAVLAEIDDLLAEAGTTKENILNVTVLLSDVADFAEMNAVYDPWVDKANPPARSTFQALLPDPQFRVEIIVTAAV